MGRHRSRHARRILHPLADFFRTETAGGAVLVLATLVALGWANSPWGDAYRNLWHTQLTIAVGKHQLALDLRGWVNDGLMTLFFFVAGLEIKRELAQGELRRIRQAALPVIAAVGGMLFPALLYLSLNHGGASEHGWGVPIATDIAMAVGVLALVGRHLPPAIRLFVLALAIVDDIGAIIVIALFYSTGVHVRALLWAGALVVVVVLMRRSGVRSMTAYAPVALVLWLGLHESGVHATLAGVILGLLTPATPLPAKDDAPTRLAEADALGDGIEPEGSGRHAVSAVEWLERLLHPWTSLVIVPLFALANAGVELSAEALRHSAASTATRGVVLGLVVGKPLGIALFSWLACCTGLGQLPPGVQWRQIIGAACLAGIGFTVSIFVSELAFNDPALVAQAKIGILAASVMAALIGATVLMSSRSLAGGPQTSTGEGRQQPQHRKRSRRYRVERARRGPVT